MAGFSPGLMHREIKGWVCDFSPHNEKVVKHSSIEVSQGTAGDTAGWGVDDPGVGVRPTESWFSFLTSDTARRGIIALPSTSNKDKLGWGVGLIVAIWFVETQRFLGTGPKK